MCCFEAPLLLPKDIRRTESSFTLYLATGATTRRLGEDAVA